MTYHSDHHDLLIILLLFFTACAQPASQEVVETSPLTEGKWRFAMDLGQDELPFVLEVYSDNDEPRADIINAEERITITDITVVADSVHLRLPLFDSELIGKMTAEGLFVGEWRNYDKGDYRLPFTATHGLSHRFCETNSADSPIDVSGKYTVAFSPENAEDRYPAIGQFEGNTTNNRVSGTFMTETGDYRFLEGNVCDGRLKLSCFDGSHAFLFIADISGDSLTNGLFRSGKHWDEPWIAVRDVDARLTNPHKITVVADSSAMHGLTFPGPEGTSYTIGGPENDGKVTILQVMGSWCPNCIDETLVFREWYNKYHDQGLDIIPIAFESARNTDDALIITDRLRERLDLPYPIYYGGYRSKKEAQERLPFLDEISSFPTSVIVDKKGNVRDVHTGFYGPGTKEYYQAYLHETESMIVELLEE